MGRVVAGLSGACAARRLLPVPLALGSRLLALRRPGLRRREAAQRLLTRLGTPGLLRLIDERRSRCDRVRLPDRHRGARPAAALRPARHPGRRRDHGSRGDALLGEPGLRRPSRHAPGVDRRGAWRSSGQRAPVALRARIHVGRSSSTRATRQPHAAKLGLPTTARSSSSRAAAGASATSSARSRRRSTIPEVTQGRLPLRPQRDPALAASGAVSRARRACASRASRSR